MARRRTEEVTGRLAAPRVDGHPGEQLAPGSSARGGAHAGEVAGHRMQPEYGRQPGAEDGGGLVTSRVREGGRQSLGLGLRASPEEGNDWRGG